QKPLDAILNLQGAAMDLEANGCVFWRLPVIPASGGMMTVLFRQLFAGTGAIIGMVRCQQLGNRLFVSLAPGGLIEERAVPQQAMGFQCRQDLGGGLRRLAQWIDVFDSNQPGTLVMAGIQIASQGADQGAEMKWAGWGWRKTPDIARGGGSGSFGVERRMPVERGHSVREHSP